MKPRALLALSLLGASAFFAWQAYQERKRLTWRPTAGSISEVWPQPSVAPPRPRYDGTWIRYSYTVNGKTYFAKGFGYRGDSPGGRLLRIYYDPEHPDRSMNGPPVDSLALPAVAILLFAGGAAVGLERRDGQR